MTIAYFVIVLPKKKKCFIKARHEIILIFDQALIMFAVFHTQTRRVRLTRYPAQLPKSRHSWIVEEITTYLSSRFDYSSSRISILIDAKAQHNITLSYGCPVYIYVLHSTALALKVFKYVAIYCIAYYCLSIFIDIRQNWNTFELYDILTSIQNFEWLLLS